MLSKEQLSCGYVQRREWNGIRVSLWREHSTYHVRAHDFNTGTRLDWEVRAKLTEARKQYSIMCRKFIRDRIMATL
jgi:hypothetical protein